MTAYGVDRRSFVGGLAAGTTLFARGARAALPPLPKSPVALSVIDVGGALALLQAGFDAYKAAKPELVSRITFVKLRPLSSPARSRRSKTPARAISISS